MSSKFVSWICAFINVLVKPKDKSFTISPRLFSICKILFLLMKQLYTYTHTFITNQICKYSAYVCVWKIISIVFSSVWIQEFHLQLLYLKWIYKTKNLSGSRLRQGKQRCVDRKKMLTIHGSIIRLKIFFFRHGQGAA